MTCFVPSHNTFILVVDIFILSNFNSQDIYLSYIIRRLTTYLIKGGAPTYRYRSINTEANHHLKTAIHIAPSNATKF